MNNVTKVSLLAALWAAAGVASAELPSVEGAWARATPPGARTGAIYLALRAGGADDRLVGAASAAAREVQIHTHVNEGGTHRMMQLPELALPSATVVRLEPGGSHLMLIDLAAPLVAGQQLSLTLDFAGGDRVEVTVPVVDARATGPDHGAH